MITTLEVLSLLLSIIGLTLAFLGIYFPEISAKLEKSLSFFANMRFRSAPKWKWERFRQRPVVSIIILILPWQLAGAIFVKEGFSWEIFAQFFGIFFILLVIFTLIAGASYASWFFIRMFAWSTYACGHQVVRLSKWINPNSEVIPGVGILIAGLSLLISFVPIALLL